MSGFLPEWQSQQDFDKVQQNLKSKGKVSHHLQSTDNDSNQAGEPLGIFNQTVVQINVILSLKCFEHKKHTLIVLSSASSPPLCLILPNGARQL